MREYFYYGIKNLHNSDHNYIFGQEIRKNPFFNGIIRLLGNTYLRNMKIASNFSPVLFLTVTWCFVACTHPSKPADIELERILMGCDSDSFSDSNILFELSIKNNRTEPIILDNDDITGTINTNSFLLASHRFNSGAVTLKLGSGSIVGNVHLVVNQGAPKKVWFYVFASKIANSLKHSFKSRITPSDVKSFFASSDFLIEFIPHSDTTIYIYPNLKKAKYSCNLNSR